MFNLFKNKPLKTDDFAQLVIAEAKKRPASVNRWNMTPSVLF